MATSACLLTFAAKVLEDAASAGASVDLTGLPEGARRLLALAAAVPERKTGHEAAPLPWLGRIGTAVTAASAGVSRCSDSSAARCWRSPRSRAAAPASSAATSPSSSRTAARARYPSSRSSASSSD